MMMGHFCYFDPFQMRKGSPGRIENPQVPAQAAGIVIGNLLRRSFKLNFFLFQFILQELGNMIYFKGDGTEDCWIIHF